MDPLTLESCGAQVSRLICGVLNGHNAGSRPWSEPDVEVIRPPWVNFQSFVQNLSSVKNSHAGKTILVCTRLQRQ